MNQYLQKALDLIAQDKNLSGEEKGTLIKSLHDADKEFEINASKLDQTEKAKRITGSLLEETIEELEQKRKAVEAQNRELEIEASLERVRTIAMGMSMPGDLLNISKANYVELTKLGFSEIRNSLIGIFHDDKNYFTDYDYSDFSGGSITNIPYNKNPIIDRSIQQMKSAIDAFTEFIVEGKELDEWKAFRKQNGEYEDTRLTDANALYYYFYSIEQGNVGISTFKKISEAQLNILKRFRNVFDLAYKRYTDITAAEAQAREAQIQLGLERIRARTMAMQNSNELPQAANVLFQQVQSLGMPAWSAGYCIWDDDKKGITLWMSSEGVMQRPFHAPLTEDPSFIHMREAYERRESFHVEEVGGEALVMHYQYMRTLPVVGEILDSIIAAGHPLPVFQIFHCVYFSQGFLLFITYEPVPQAHDIFKRFGKVFDQTYTRFLDLQKAEAQAREAEIELALERVRARTMAMQKSDELAQVASLLFAQVIALDINCYSSGFTVWDNENTELISWMCNADGSVNPPFRMPAFDIEWHKQQLESWKNQEEYIIHDFTGNEMQELYRYLRSFPLLDEAFKKSEAAGVQTPVRQVHNAFNFSYGNLLFITLQPSPESYTIFKRFAKVFEQTYTRFLDLQNAEAQAREARIETALEKIRSRSLAMHKSDELWEVIAVVFEKFQELKFSIDGAAFIITFIEGSGDLNTWVADAQGQSYPSSVRLPYYESPSINDIWLAKESGLDFFSKTYSYEEKNHWLKYAFEHSHLKTVADEYKNWMLEQPFLTQSFAFGKNSMIGIHFHHQRTLAETEVDILKRFSKVFDQAYIRFLDLQKAEAQAKEAQIQLALERGRTQSMIMQHSKELDDTLRVFHEQVLLLGINSAFSFLWLPDEEKSKHIFWAAWAEHKGETTIFKSKAVTYPLDRNEPATAQCLVDWKSGESVFSYAVPPEGVKNYFAAWQELIDGVEQLTPQHFSNGLYYVEAFMKYGCFGVMLENDLTDNEKKILDRFATEFERAYTRFLDLQKAEAQAREAEIELALERVRARTMAMQHSDELAEASLLLDSQVRVLGIKTRGCGFNIYGDNESTEWFSSEMGTMPTYKTPREGVFLRYYEEGKTGKSMYIETFTGEGCAAHYEYLCTLPVVGEGLRKLKESGGSFPVHQIDHVTYFKYGYLLFITLEPVPDAHDIFIRFAKVFEQTYTRFLDLQKAEAQAREAQIEAALERVRSRTMAMHNSADVGETVAALFDELPKLGVHANRCGILINSDEAMQSEVWTAKSNPRGKANLIIGQLDLTMHPLLEGIYHAWKNREPVFHYTMTGDDLKSYYQAINNTKYYPTQFDLDALPSMEFHTDFYFAEGCIFAFTPQPVSDEAAAIFKRFAKVFGQTYRRYLDLQKAEAQAREAKIETALERVRSRTLAMQKSNELAETAAVLFNQLVLLGIEPNRLYIGIIKDDDGHIEFWATDEEGSRISTMFIGDTSRNVSMKKMYDAWKVEKKSLTIDMQGKELNDYFQYMADELKVPFTKGLSQKRRIQSIAFFGKGFLGIASPDEQPEATTQLLERFAAVFNLTYTRFNDLQIAEAHALQAEQDLKAIKEARQNAEAALTELQATQKQLIQSEKMASLGELTAGIAHEIQNPLNFVNNFSEVSKELLEEMREAMDKGDAGEAKEIMNDVIQNLEKINHHGRRADGIVKGMLQHSRSSSSHKEPTDINALADEYLRLAYHGLRAKDKSFNATLKTNYDDAIGTINIVPQDIGRVILNLINNAFYAVAEKKKSPHPLKGSEEYEPTVSVTTTKKNQQVEIIVSDNGNGIPQQISDKIFQPFFTTKPTGQGTGLGLSLSYDIVKAHGGEIKVESKEGEGSTFIVILPDR